MKRRLAVLTLCVAWSGIAWAAVYFDNGTGNNNYADPGNWNSFPNAYPAVNTTGSDRAIVSTDTSTLSTPATKVWIANNPGTVGEVEVASGGTLYASQQIYVGYKGTGLLTLNGGTVTSTTLDVDIGTVAGADGTLIMNSGTINAHRFFVVGNTGTGYMQLNDGVINVNTYDFQIADDAGSNGTFDMYGGVMNIARDVTVGGAGTGLMNMYGGVINAAGKITIPELVGGDGALNLYNDSVINAKLFMRNLGAPDPSNSQLVNIYDDAQIIMADGDGLIATEIQGYIDSGWVNGSVSWDGATTVVAAIPEPAMIGMLMAGCGTLMVLRRFAF